MANITPCNFLAPTVIEASVPFDPFFKRTKKKILFHTKFRLSSLKEKLFPKKMTKKITSISESPISETTTLNLQPGEWVQVRSFDEISATLNEEGKFKGLYFMPEMEKFCGKKFKVDSSW